MTVRDEPPYAVWALTPGGKTLARTIAIGLGGAAVHLPYNLKDAPADMNSIHRFERLSVAVAECFHHYRGHIFIMAAGIVVRMIAPCIADKTRDPAVVAVDDQGTWSVSLLSGHIGGANRLAREIADIIGAQAVITTATDVHGLPAIDTLAADQHLHIENPAAVKHINKAILNGHPFVLVDPFKHVAGHLDERFFREQARPDGGSPQRSADPVVVVSDRQVDLAPHVLVLRPESLAAGIGCNRNTPKQEIRDLLEAVMQDHGLAVKSLACLASASAKQAEPGLIALAREMGLPISFFAPHELNRAEGILNPSAMAEKHIGVKSVCEAAAILASKGGKLIVPKQKTPNVTLAIARIAFIS